MKKYQKNTGAAFIFSVVCLSVLLVLSIVFFKQAVLDRDAANYLKAKKEAFLTAQAAVDFACTQIPYETMNVAYSDPDKKHQYKDAFDTTLETSQNPSFYDSKHPILGFAYSKKYAGPSGAYSGRYATLKVIDANAFFNINAPLNNAFETMSENLFKFAFNYTESQAKKITQAIVNERTTCGNYKRVSDMYHLVSSGLVTPEKFLEFPKYINVSSWGNKNALKYGTSLVTPKQETRYPVNINVAPLEVLQVVLTGIQAKSEYAGNPVIISELTAEKVAKAIIEKREDTDSVEEETDSTKDNGPFKTWNEVEDFLTSDLVTKGVLSKNQGQTIFANVYPDVRLNKKDPDIFHFRNFDKLDIIRGTTEFCLFSPGIFYIESIGRMVINNRKVMADAKVTANMKLWEPYIVNTQQEFDNKRKQSLNYDAWSAINASRPFDTKTVKNNYFGYLFERNPSSDVACRYWDYANEKRPDGAYMEGNEATVDDWEDYGFDLWIKPGYHFTNDFIIAEKHETADGPGHIVTRCAYKNPSKGNAYILLSRTYAVTSGNTLPKREYQTRVFYGATLYGNARANLRQCGYTTYSLVVIELNRLYQDQYVEGSTIVIRSVNRTNDESKVDAFAARVSQKIYGSFGSGHSSVQTPGDSCEIIVKYIRIHSDGSVTTDEEKRTVYVTFYVESPWNSITVTCDDICSGHSMSIEKELWKYIFTSEPTVKPVNRSSYQPEGVDEPEAVDINYFPDSPVQTSYKYSRTESRAYLTLSRGVWYHITGRWDKMLVTELTVTEKGKKTTLVNEPNFYGGPLHVWPLINDLKYGVRYKSKNCIIYQSYYRDTKQVVRYWPRTLWGTNSSSFSGTFDFSTVSVNNFRFGTVSWTRFVPEGKGEPITSISCNSKSANFSNRGKDLSKANGTNSLFRSPLTKASEVDYEIHLLVTNGTFETTMLDNITLFLLVQPEAVTYKTE